jgi:copper homeostasis protein
MARLEVIACTLEDALAAAQGGADSLELCIDLHLEGLSPPLDLVRRIGEAVSLPLNVMVRPHAQSFCYSAEDLAWCERYSKALRPLNPHTLVFGAQTHAGEIDIEVIQRIATWADPIPLTLHRALDSAQQPDAALRALRGTVERVLTSGAAACAWDGQSTLQAWLAEFGQSYTFALAGGISQANLAALHQNLAAPEYHVGSAARLNGQVQTEKVALLKTLLAHS